MHPGNLGPLVAPPSPPRGWLPPAGMLPDIPFPRNPLLSGDGQAHGPSPVPQTQPVPNPVAYFLHQSPWWVHRGETLGNHFVELVVPFFIFLGRRMCVLHGALQILFQVSPRRLRVAPVPASPR